MGRSAEQGWLKDAGRSTWLSGWTSTSFRGDTQDRRAGVFALGDNKKGLGLDVCTTGLTVIMAVDKFVPEHRDQAATLSIQLLLRACNTARGATPPTVDQIACLTRSPEDRKVAVQGRMRFLLHRHAARVIVLAWSFGLRFKHMQRFTPSIDETDPEGVMAGRPSLAKDGDPPDVFAPAMDLLGKVGLVCGFCDRKCEVVTKRRRQSRDLR